MLDLIRDAYTSSAVAAAAASSTHTHYDASNEVAVAAGVWRQSSPWTQIIKHHVSLRNGGLRPRAGHLALILNCLPELPPPFLFCLMRKEPNASQNCLPELPPRTTSRSSTHAHSKGCELVL